MPNRQPQSQVTQARLILVGLICVTALLVLVMAVQPLDVRALQGDSPLPTDIPIPTDTPVPVPTDTPIPTDTPVPAPTDTPVPDDTATCTQSISSRAVTG